MDCRTLVVLGMLTSVSGCTYTLPALRITTNASKTDKDDIVHKAPTYVAFGEFRARLAESKDHPAEQRQEFREQARLSYLKALEIDPKCLAAHQALGRLLQAAEDYDGALEHYNKALKISPKEPGIWVELGMCQCRMKNWSGGLTSMKKALELDPKNRQYLTLTGFALARAGEWEEAFVTLSKVHGAARAHYDLARMLLHLNRTELAREHAVAALQADPKLEKAKNLLHDIDNPRAAASPIQQTNHTETSQVPNSQHSPASNKGSPGSTTPPAEPGELPKIFTPASVNQSQTQLPTQPDSPSSGSGETDLVTPASEEPQAQAGGRETEKGRRPIRVPPLPVTKNPGQGK